MAHLSIVPEDNAVSKGGKGFGGLNLSSCNIPANINALQWNGTSGWVEFITPIENEDITELPAWAIAAEALWQEASDAQDAEDAANADPVQPDDYMVDRDTELTTKLDQYKEVAVSTVNKLIDKQFTGINLVPFVREHDATLIGVEIDMVAGSESVQAGSATLLSVRSALTHCKEKGVPIVTRAYIVYAARAEEIHNILVDMGYEVLHTKGDMWYMTPHSLDLEKAHKKTTINVERDASIDNGYNDGTNTWDIDSQSMTNMTSKTVGLADDGSVTWRSKTNTDVTMTGAEFKTLVENAVAAVGVIYQNSWTRKAAVDNATTQADLDAI